MVVLYLINLVLCQFKHYLFTTKKHVPIKNINNMRQRSSLFDLTSSSVVKELDVVAARTSVDSNYIEIEASSSISISLTHQRYMCQSKHYLFTIERHVPIRNEDNMKQPTTLYLL
jgi:transposase-like protein